MSSPLKVFLLIVPLKSNQRQEKISILSPRCSNLSLVCVAHCGDHLRSGLRTREIISAVCCTLHIWSPRYVGDGWDDLCGMLHTAEIVLAVCCTLRIQLYDRISQRNRNRIRKYFSLIIRGSDGFQSWKKLEVENLVTHSLALNSKKHVNMHW